jgi:hypothetical protein
LEKLGLVKEEPRTHITVMQWSLLEWKLLQHTYTFLLSSAP